MNWFQRGTGERDVGILILIHGIANTTLGITYLLWVQSSAENILTRLFPYWLWPCMFLVAGLMAFIGFWYRDLARYSFAFAGVIMGVFALASVAAVWQTHNLAIIPSAIFLTYLTILKIQVARMLDQRQNIVRQITDATQEGKNALERVKDGTTST